MFKRTLSKKLTALVKRFPVVSIMGPRQSGKTTLSKIVFEKHDYVSLEEPNEREFALADPKGFLRRFTGGVILDEIQRAPALLSYIHRKPGDISEVCAAMRRQNRAVAEPFVAGL